MKQKSEMKENPAVMYKSRSKAGEVMFNLTIKPEELPRPNEKGEIRLVGFVNSYKSKDIHPDVLFYPPRPRPSQEQRPIRQKSTPDSSEKAGGNDWF